MSLEYRGGRAYFYRARRVNGRVVKTYAGHGVFALAEAEAAASERAEREQLRATERAASDDYTAADAQLAALDEAIAVELKAAGLHRHKRGRLRRKRQ